MGWFFVAFCAIFVVAAGAPVAAQEPTPQPGQAASKLLPSASVLGEGWSQAQTVSPGVLGSHAFKMSPDVFREGAVRVYLGPQGARVLVVSLLLTENRVAIRRSWEDASKLLDNLDDQMETNYQHQQDLESMAPPPGCVEAKRVEGTEDFYLTPVGATLCAINPDIVVLAVVSGTLSRANGIAASDAMAQRISGVRPGGTPTC